MKIFSTKDIKMLAGAMAASILFGGCTAPVSTDVNVTKNDPDVKTEIDLKNVKNTEYDEDLMDQEYRRYCFDILSQTIKNTGTNENVMISPASIMMALDMIAAGAKGESLEQLTVLFAGGHGPLTQQAYAADLMEKINSAKEVEFSCANAVWSNKAILGDAVNPEYIGYIQDTFDADYKVGDFDDKTTDEINDWVYEHTDHMIRKVVDGLNPSTVMVLVNAISFDGKWEDPYKEHQVKEGDFTKWDGSTQKVDFLHASSENYFETGKAVGFMKNYEGDQYAFLVILPADEKISANEFIESFTSEDYEAFIASKTYDYAVSTKIPAFESDFSCGLIDVLEDLGVEDVFNSETADLSGIAGAPGDIFVSTVIHKTHIEVDAQGTKAAAVTAITLDNAGAFITEKDFRFVECDRPFAYAIVDTESMLPVFIGTVNEI